MPSAWLGLLRPGATPSARTSTIGIVVVTEHSNSLMTTNGLALEPSAVPVSFAPPAPGFGVSEPRPVIDESACAAPLGALLEVLAHEGLVVDVLRLLAAVAERAR